MGLINSAHSALLTALFFALVAAAIPGDAAAEDIQMAESKTALPRVEQTATGLQVKILTAGAIASPKNMMVEGGEKIKIELPALFAVIRHPSLGDILFDSGYSTHFFDATKEFPFFFMRYTAPLNVTEKDNAVSQVRGMGIAPESVAAIIISHCHADHTGGLKDFPRARVIVSKDEWSAANGSKLSTLRRMYLRRLYQGLDPARLELVDFAARGKPYGIFPQAYDLAGDGSMILIALPGHTAGNMGLLLNLSPSQRIFMVGDAAYLRENYRLNRPPGWAPRMIVADEGLLKENLARLSEVANRNPETMIVPAHCPEAWQETARAQAAASEGWITP